MSKRATMQQTDAKGLLPWRWAESLQTCSLFWIPVRFESIPQSQREWLLKFFTRLASLLVEKKKLRAEQFMQMQVIDEDEKLRKSFLDGLMKESPLLGRCWFPRGKQPTNATGQEVDVLASKKKEFRPYDYVHPQAWWFLGGDAGGLREHYLGYGGFTILFLKQDSEESLATVPVMASSPMILPKFLRSDRGVKALLEDFDALQPQKIPGVVRNHSAMKQVFSLFDVGGMDRKNQALMSPFRDQSKEIFGSRIPRDLEFEGVPFVLPKLSSQDFFAQTDDQIRRWFEVFDVYINESPEDEGFLLAGKEDITWAMASIANEMRDAGYRYWEG
jgi:hypothetical protein